MTVNYHFLLKKLLLLLTLFIFCYANICMAISPVTFRIATYNGYDVCAMDFGSVDILSTSWRHVNTGTYNGGGFYQFKIASSRSIRQIQIGPCVARGLHIMLYPGTTYTLTITRELPEDMIYVPPEFHLHIDKCCNFYAATLHKKVVYKK